MAKKAYVYNGNAWEDLASSVSDLSSYATTVDLDDYQLKSVAGLTLVASGSTSATSTLTLDNVFTSAYRNYKLFIDGVSSANDIDIVLKLRTGGVTNSNANYAQAQISSSAAYGITRSSGTGNTSFTSTLAGGTIKIVHESIFFAPQVAIATGYQSMSTSLSATFWQYLFGGSFADTTQFDGFIFTPTSGTITLNYRLYGMAD